MAMKNKQLKATDIKIVEGKIAGKTSYEIAEDTGLKPQTVRKNLQKATIQDAVRAEMLRQGITLEKVIKPVTEALEASEAIYAKDGTFIDSKPSHSIRLQASDRAAKWLGIDKAVSSSDDSPMTAEDIKQLAGESDEMVLTQLLFRKQG